MTADSGTVSLDYLSRYRRLLIDTHIPDWDERFLRRFDPRQCVQAALDSGSTALMVYTQSHTGLCHWPTASGRQHPAFVDRDLLAELLADAHAAQLPVCAYYSVTFNNWAAQAHPEWRIEPAGAEVIGGGALQRERYGICCLNNREYVDFARTQTREILRRYRVDAFFFDMVWWMSVCSCPSCRGRYRAEAGRELPEIVDWLDPRWCGFQAARERWLNEFAEVLRGTVRESRPDIPVYHNFALGAANWTRAVSFESARAHDFLGGDFYGGAEEQLLVSRLMLNLSERRPVEFMTTVTASLAEHERLKPQDLLDTQCLAATSLHAAFLAILAFDPDGTISPPAVERIRAMFARSAPFEPYLGGAPVEDVGVYFSSESKMNFADNGRSVREAAGGSAVDYPHLHSVSGACRILQEAHLPFGVITRRQLGELSRYRVIVLPNVLRMDAVEVSALRNYVSAGGRLYASRYTSLTDVDGRRHGDFLLADVFGCHFDGIEPGRNFYLTPESELSAQAIAPERYVSHWSPPTENTGAVRLRVDTEGRTLMKLTLPYGYPSRGSLDGRDWASIHSFPPWDHTDRPTVVENCCGAGRAIYSAADLEAGKSPAHDALFLALVTSLLGDAASFGSDAHPVVWMSVFEQPEHGRRVVSLLNNSPTQPQLPIPSFGFWLFPSAGRRFARLIELPDGRDVQFATRADGAMRVSLPGLRAFAMYAAYYR